MLNLPTIGKGCSQLPSLLFKEFNFFPGRNGFQKDTRYLHSLTPQYLLMTRWIQLGVVAFWYCKQLLLMYSQNCVLLEMIHNYSVFCLCC